MIVNLLALCFLMLFTIKILNPLLLPIKTFIFAALIQYGKVKKALGNRI